MKFCVQPPIRHPFALANFQLGRKGQRPKGRKVKRPNFQKLSEAFLIKSKVVPDVFMSIFKLKGPISRNFALELIVPCCRTGSDNTQSFFYKQCRKMIATNEAESIQGNA